MKSYSMSNYLENTPKIVIILTLTLVLLTIVPLYFSLFLTSPWGSPSPSPSSSHNDVNDRLRGVRNPQNCDIFRGEWVPNPSAPYYTNETCSAIHEHQNCMKYGRPDTDFMKWRWKPDECELPIFSPAHFLELVRGKSLAFLGDSVGRNQMQSLMCLLSKAQQREKTLQEENAAYEKAISNCQQKIEEMLHEAGLLESKLKEMDLIEKELKVELDKALEDKASQHETSATASNVIEKVQEAESSKSVKPKDLENKKNELRLLEETVQRLEDEWSLLQQESLRKPSPAQREKLLEKQLHSLIEQLTAKQAQAERLVTDIHVKEKDLERLTDMQRKLDSGVAEMNAARNRFGRSFIVSGASNDYDIKAYRRPNHPGGRTENQQKLMLLRSAFVLYTLALHIIVFIRLSF